MTLLFHGHTMRCFIRLRQRCLSRYFVKTGIFEKRLGRDLNIIFDERQLGDYESNFSISEENARHTFESARGFVDKVAEWLKSDLSDD